MNSIKLRKWQFLRLKYVIMDSIIIAAAMEALIKFLGIIQ